MIVVLHNIRSKHNVGSIFRTSDALGVNKIYLCGITPSPIDKYQRKDHAIAKVSLGAENNIKWEKCKDTKNIILELEKLDYQIFALEQNKNSIPYFKLKINKKIFDKMALVLGSEIDGVPEDIYKNVDKIIEIPMVGKKESLNVSVAYGIVAFSLKYSKI